MSIDKIIYLLPDTEGSEPRELSENTRELEEKTTTKLTERQNAVKISTAESLENCSSVSVHSRTF
jgi:hypothetical protein